MKRTGLRLPGLLLVAAVAAGCGGGGSGSGGSFSNGDPLSSGPTSNAQTPQGTAVTSQTGQGSVKAVSAIALPKGFEDPRAIALGCNGEIFVSAREQSSGQAVILMMNASTTTVFARGDVPGTPGKMTNPVALAVGGGKLYVADFSSDFSTTATGAILAIDSSGTISVLSAGMIDAPTGVLVQQDGSLAVCGADPDDGIGAVYKVDATSGAVSVLGKGGALTQPTGIGLDASGKLVVSDAGKRLDKAQLVSISTGGTPALVAAITNACDVESGVATLGNQTLVAARHASAGRVSSVTGSTESVGFEGAPLVAPAGLVADGINLYVADQQAADVGQILVLR